MFKNNKVQYFVNTLVAKIIYQLNTIIVKVLIYTLNEWYLSTNVYKLCYSQMEKM